MYSIMIIMLLCSFVGRHEFLFFEIMQTAGLLGSFFFEEIWLIRVFIFLFFWVPSLLKDGVCFAYRYWPNNRSRMYLIENTGN